MARIHGRHVFHEVAGQVRNGTLELAPHFSKRRSGGARGKLPLDVSPDLRRDGRTHLRHGLVVHDRRKLLRCCNRVRRGGSLGGQWSGKNPQKKKSLPPGFPPPPSGASQNKPSRSRGARNPPAVPFRLPNASP